MNLRSAWLPAVVGVGLCVAPAPSSVRAGTPSGASPAAHAAARPGRIVVRFAPGALAPVARGERDADGVLRTGIAGLDRRSARWKVAGSRALFDAPADPSLARALDLGAFRVLAIDSAADPVAAAADFAGDPRVLSAEPDWIAQPDAAPDDPRYPDNWGHHNTGQLPSWNTAAGTFSGPPVGVPGFDCGAEAAWDSPAGWGAASTVIALIDADGVDLQHADLRLVAGWDFTGNDPNPDDPCTSPGIGCGHGTKCAGIMAAVADDGFGTAGVAGGCSVMPFRAAGTSEVAAALVAAADSGAAVANLSFTWYGVTSNAAVAAAAAYAAAHDVLIFSSSGNRNDNSVMWMPQVLPEIYAVGSASPCGTRKRSSSIPSELRPDVQPDPAGASCDNERNWGSSWGGPVQDAPDALDLLAPVILPAPEVGGGFEPFFSGTSASCAYASGVAALLRSVHPEWTAVQTRDRLFATARDIADAESAPGWDVRTGYGLVHAGDAVGTPVFPANLAPSAPAGWAGALVPRDVPDATPSSAPAPARLAGDAGTWINAAWINEGAGGAAPCTTVVRLDGAPLLALAAGALPAASEHVEINAPCTVPGGRHTLELVLDAGGAIEESDETDNAIAVSRVFEPAPLPADVPVERAPPPDPWGGASSPGGGPWPNRDGVRLATSPAAAVFAVALHPADPAESYELAVFPASAGPDDGFADGTALAVSHRGAGALDFALVSTRDADPVVADAGILAGGAGAVSPSRIEWREGPAASPGGVWPLAFAEHAMLAAGEIEIAPGDSGAYAFELAMADSAGAVTLALFAPGAGWRTLADTLWTAATDEPAFGPFAAVRIAALDAGFHPWIVFRDPANGTAAAAATLRVRPAPADVTPATPPGGHAPLVPAMNVFGDECDAWPAPIELRADAPTHFRYSWRNLGPPASADQTTAVSLDGKAILFADPGREPDGTFCRMGMLGLVRGGRHTLTLALDVDDANAGIFRDDDRTGEQWVWQPPVLMPGVTVVAPMPPLPAAGHDAVTVPPLFENLDGFRTPAVDTTAADGRLALAVVVPDPEADVDLLLFTPSTGPKSGFDDPSRLASSATPGAAVELVIADAVAGRGGVPGPRDAGVRAAGGDTGYAIEASTSTFVLLGPGFPVAADSLPAGRAARVWETVMPAGAAPIVLRLRALDGTADLDLAVVALDGDGAYGRADALVADAAGAGAHEDLVLAHAPGTPLAIAVFKHGAADLPVAATFELLLADSTATAVVSAPAAPPRPGLRGIAPNPFAPHTTVSFELAARGPAELAVYDTRGRRVRRLAEATLAAGRHALPWDGTDDAGRPVGSGVYFVRLRAGGLDEVRKVTRLR